MKTRLLKNVAWIIGLAWMTATVRGGEEDDLIAVLQSAADAPAKANVCARIRLVGTARAVPALAALLSGEQTSQAARYALEGMPCGEAVAALRRAFHDASGPMRLGIIDSLGWRRDTESIPALIPLLTGGDPLLASAAASALGRMGVGEAFAALESARENVAREVRPAIVDGLLASAEQAAAQGRQSEAVHLYESLLESSEPESVRVAAFSGRWRALGDGGLDWMITALRGGDRAARIAALNCALEAKGDVATLAFAHLLPTLEPELRIALLQIVQKRGGGAAADAARAASRDSESSVRAAAFCALGVLGGAGDVALLTEAAVSTNILERTAAQEALTTLRGPDVTAALLARVDSAPPELRRQTFRTVAQRADPAAIPMLLDMARNGRPPIREGALQAVGRLADSRHLSELGQLLAEVTDESAREEVRGVFEMLVERFGEDGMDVAPIVQGLTEGRPETRAMMFRVAPLFLDHRIRDAFRAALTDPESNVRDAATQSLCATRDPGLLPDLLELCRHAAEARLRSQALEGAVRLATDESSGFGAAEQSDLLASAYGAARTVEDRQTVLSGLAHVTDSRALDITGRAISDPAVRSAAELASLQIASRLVTSNVTAVEWTVIRLAESALDSNVRTQARALWLRLHSAWQCVGPYRQEGRQGPDLFDVVFPPEQTGGPSLPWRPAIGSGDASKPEQIDLGGIAGGDHCVVYARTRVYAPAEQSVEFAIGSDDGIKLWVNGSLVHANNAVRGLVAGQDRARGQLRQGWNDLLAKITQSTAGCGLVVQIRSENGAAIPGLIVDAAGGTVP